MSTLPSSTTTLPDRHVAATAFKRLLFAALVLAVLAAPTIILAVAG